MQQDSVTSGKTAQDLRLRRAPIIMMLLCGAEKEIARSPHPDREDLLKLLKITASRRDQDVHNT